MHIKHQRRQVKSIRSIDVSFRAVVCETDHVVVKCIIGYLNEKVPGKYISKVN